MGKEEQTKKKIAQYARLIEIVKRQIKPLDKRKVGQF